MTTTPEDEAAAREYAFAENTLHRENLRAYFEQGEVKDGRVNWDIETLITLIVSEMYEARKKALLAGITHAREQMPRWVSCAEMLPEENDFYAVVVDAPYMRKRVVFFRAHDQVWVDCFDKVTHWMHLPSAPEKEQP